MHWYKRNIGDYAKKAGRLSMLQHGAYTLLIDSCYDRERFPTLEEAYDWTWASTTEEREAVDFVLSRFFVLDGEHYRQTRIEEEIEHYREKASNNQRIAKEREAKRAKNSTKREQPVNEAPPNQEPVTNNQEPVTNKKTKTSMSSSPKNDPVPVKAIVDLYHDVLPELPACKKITAARESAIKQRWREDMPSIQNWENYFNYIRRSDFLMGRTEPRNGKTVFRADLEWVTKAANFAKIYEDKYHGV